MIQREYDKLIAIASSMKFELQVRGAKSIVVQTSHGQDEGKIEIMSLEKIDEFLDTVFEYQIKE